MGRGRDLIDEVLVAIWDGITVTTATVDGPQNASIAGPTNAAVYDDASAYESTHPTYTIDDSRWNNGADAINLARITVTVS